MRASKEIVTAVGTLALAVGIGFVMQSTDEAKDRYGVRTAPKIEDADAVTGAAFLPGLRRVQFTSAGDSDTSGVSEPLTTAAECRTDTSGRVLPGALVQLTLVAPCKQNERLVIHHNGLMVTARTDERGAMTATIPALAPEAVFMVSFEAGSSAVVQAQVSELNDMRRAVLQWTGASGFELHALEFGADYETPGHIWSGIETVDSVAIGLDHGFVTRLGNAEVAQPMMAEVYTYPVAQGPIDLRIEAEISAENCGRDLEVQAIHYDQGDLRSEEVILSIPDCSLMGDLLVLSNLIGNDVLASR